MRLVLTAVGGIVQAVSSKPGLAISNHSGVGWSSTAMNFPARSACYKSRRAIPETERFGTKFVFRQGNPLVVRDLDMVAAQHARTTMIVSDQSRCPEEADAQSLRCAILLCELTSSVQMGSREKDKKSTSWKFFDGIMQGNDKGTKSGSSNNQQSTGATAVKTKKSPSPNSSPTSSPKATPKGSPKGSPRSSVDSLDEPVAKVVEAFTELTNAVTSDVAQLTADSEEAEYDPTDQETEELERKKAANMAAITKIVGGVPSSGALRPFSAPQEAVSAANVKSQDPSLSVLPPAIPKASALAVAAVASDGLKISAAKPTQDKAGTSTKTADKVATAPANNVVQIGANTNNGTKASAVTGNSDASKNSSSSNVVKNNGGNTSSNGVTNKQASSNGVSSNKQDATQRSNDSPGTQAQHTTQSKNSLDGLQEMAADISEGHVIVELKTANAMSLLRFACSPRFQAVPTAFLNARRIAKMVREPIIASVSQQLLDFTKCTNMYVQYAPQLVGKRFAELAFCWDDAIVIGVYQNHRGNVKLNPSPNYKVLPTDKLILLRPTDKAEDQHGPLPVPVDVSCQTAWVARKLALQQEKAQATAAAATLDIINKQKEAVTVSSNGTTPSKPDSYSQNGTKTQSSAVGSSSRDGNGNGHQPVSDPWIAQASTAAAQHPSNPQPTAVTTTVFSNGSQQQQQATDAWIANVSSQLTSDTVPSSSNGTVQTSSTTDTTRVLNRPGSPSEALSSQDQYNLKSMATTTTTTSSSSNSGSSTTGSFDSALQISAMFMVPLEYLLTDDRPRRVLLCGWGEQSFMQALLRELDAGTAALPPGSEVVFVNIHDTQATLGKAVQAVQPRNISVSHVVANPLQRTELAQVRVNEFSSAIVLCDERWIDPDEDASNGVDPQCQGDMLRLDSMVMMVQLNLRKLLEDQERPSMNIICQKVAMEGMTRFEDRTRLPLGISVNLTSFAAKLLTQASYNRLFLPAFSEYGSPCSNLGVLDASELAEKGEKLSWWQIVARAQALQKVVIGWYNLPVRVNDPMEVVINPQGMALRSKRRVWYKGDNALKFLVVGTKDNNISMTACSLDETVEDDARDDLLSAALDELDNRQARWVRLGSYQAQPERDVDIVASMSDSD